MNISTNSADYYNVVVNKPWGYEYLIYENGTVSIWCLFIRHGGRTSLHCHPRKKTGLILLSGEATISFLTESKTFKPLNKLMIKEGVFHSTTAVSPEGVVVLETETPCDKGNLVRLDDAYGREEQPYEGADATTPIGKECVRLSPPEEGKTFSYEMSGCTLSVEKFKDASGFLRRPSGEIVVVLEGGLVSRTGEPVVRPGDVVSSEILARLARAFDAPNGASLIAIRKES